MRMVLISCKFPRRLAEELERLAKERGVSLSELVRKAVADLLIDELAPREDEDGWA